MKSFSVRHLILTVALLVPASVRADWPTFQHDISRSGSTAESVPNDPQELWRYETPFKPVPAWDEPALWDGWGKVHDLKNRQVFDKAIQVALEANRLYFGSSVDDQVYCVDATTGKPIWQFFTEGPVRLAPYLRDGRVYFGSDDGFVYCLNSNDGTLIWKHRPGPSDRRVVGNGRLISPWAIRTGVVAIGDTVYCGAGVIPSEGVYVVAMNADTGEEVWKTKTQDLPAQGYMLASDSRLYVVTARDTPVVLDAKTGKRLYKVKGGTGGTYALLSGDTLLYGPNKTGDVSMVGNNQDVLASFQGNQMIVARPWSYLQSKNQLSSLDRGRYVELYGERGAMAKRQGSVADALKKAKEANDEAAIEARRAELEEIKQRLADITAEIKACVQWTTECFAPYSLVLADGVLVAGGDRHVVAVNAETGEELWKLAVPGKAYGLAVTDDKLYVSTDEGTIHCFGNPSGDEAPETTDLATHQRPPYLGPPKKPAEKMPAGFHGPFAEFIAPGKVRVTWDTLEPMTSTVRLFHPFERERSWSSDEVSRYHELILDDVKPEIVYQFQVGGTQASGTAVLSPKYQFDSFLNYLPPKTETIAAAYPDDERGAHFQELTTSLFESGTPRRGQVLILGATDGRLAFELAQKSDLKITILEPSPERVAEIRERLAATGLYGARIAVHSCDLTRIPYGPFLANLVISESMLDGESFDVPFDTIYNCLRPAGGLLCWGLRDGAGSETTSISLPEATDAIDWKSLSLEGTQCWLHQRPKLPGTGEWSHQYASPDNSACSNDDVIQGPMNVLWWGRPGARPMPDRGNRNPPPVSANGRLYVQGNRTLFGLDAYNGAILWAKQIPNMRRANMPRDGSNMVATDDHLFVAMEDRCVVFDGQTGVRLKDLEIPEDVRGKIQDWGFVAAVDNEQLIGSSVNPGAHYLGDDGEWYETAAQKDIAKVTSNSLFSTNTYTGETQWMYENGVLINSSITIADGRIYFIESRNEAASESTSGRLLDEIAKDQYLVALDAATGKKLWEKPFDFSRCRYVTYMTHSKDTLLITGTDSDSVFHTYAFDARDGSELWANQAKELKGHHTGQLAHPTIVGDRVYFNKHTYVLRTGEVLGVHNFDWHGCGVMSASNHTVFSRYEYHGMLDLATNKRTEFLGIRSGCWLSLIPSGGLLLAPETSAGCSCGHSLQTSIAFVPQKIIEKKAD